MNLDPKILVAGLKLIWVCILVGTFCVQTDEETLGSFEECSNVWKRDENLRKTYGLGSQIGGGHYQLHAYTDASWKYDVKMKRSTAGTLTFVDGHLVDWTFNLQSIVAHITAEAENIVVDWRRELLCGLDIYWRSYMRRRVRQQ